MTFDNEAELIKVKKTFPEAKYESQLHFFFLLSPRIFRTFLSNFSYFGGMIPIWGPSNLAYEWLIPIFS